MAASERGFGRARAHSAAVMSFVLLLGAGGARAQTPGDWEALEGLDSELSGRLVRLSTDNLRLPGTFVDGKLRRPALWDYDFRSRRFNRLAVTPPGRADTGGSATNQSRSGSCVIGHQDAGNGTPYHAFRWTAAAGPVDLGTLDAANNGSRTSDAANVSDDCNVIVGTSQYNANGFAQHAYRWTAAGGMVDLGAPAGAGRNSRAFGVSGAGDVVVGEAEFVDASAFSGFRTGAYRWTAAGGFQSLGALEPGFFTSAVAVTADGTTIVGNGGVGNGSRAFRWTAAAGLVPIGPLAGHSHADAAAISDNGKIVAGTSSTGPLDRNAAGGALRGTGTAFRWTQASGIQDLRQLLVAAGVDMTGVTLLSVTGMSPDGQWIAGTATTPTTAAGETVGYLVKYCDDAIGAACAQVGTTPTPSFAIGASGSALTVAAGQSASTTLTVTPVGGFGNAVTFSCSGLPRGATCSFAPASVTPAGAAVTTTLTIATDGGPVALWLRAHPGVALALLLPVFFRWRPGDPRGARRRAWLAAASVAAWLVVACGGGGGGGGNEGGSGGGNPTPPATGTPAGTSTVTVTATSGSGAAAVSRTAALTLTVTR
ncbi:MAG: hypothetical protein JNL85_11560 [Rubrivivax sp.]|nr:hypothetical protein [Rubrivivax sp.]